MRRYIFILTILMQALIIDAQNDNSIRQLIQYLEKNHPEELSNSTVNRTNDDIYEIWVWNKSFYTQRDKPIDRYHLQQLKDTIMQYFIDASADAVACHHLQTTNGTEDSIRYALSLSEDSRRTTKLVGDDRNFCYEGKEVALFYYYPQRKGESRIEVRYSNSTDQESCGKVLDIKPVKPMIAKIAREFGGEAYPVSYSYNTQEDGLDHLTRYTYVSLDNTQFEGGDRFKVLEGACSGILYIIPQEKADNAAITLHQELSNYLQSHRDRQFDYIYDRGLKKTILFKTPNQGIKYSSPDVTHEHVYSKKDIFGRYTILFVDHVDSTFALPNDYETMLSYDHGKVERVPDYEKLQQVLPPVVSSEPFWGNTIYVFFKNNHKRLEWIGGESYRTIQTIQSNIDRQSVNEIRRQLVNNPLVNIQHKESHTAEGDTLELTGEENSKPIRHLLCKFYGKGDSLTAYMQVIIDQPNPSPHVMPFDTRWVDRFIAQMKDSACIEEHKVHYEYGKKLHPESMGKVDGRLYVLTSANNLQKHAIFMDYMFNQTFSNRNQSFHIVLDESNVRITDRIIGWSDKKTNQFRLLCIDKVEGKYLIPEEWYNIISYRYGKKKYLNKRK